MILTHRCLIHLRFYSCLILLLLLFHFNQFVFINCILLLITHKWHRICTYLIVQMLVTFVILILLHYLRYIPHCASASDPFDLYPKPNKYLIIANLLSYKNNYNFKCYVITIYRQRVLEIIKNKLSSFGTCEDSVNYCGKKRNE